MGLIVEIAQMTGKKVAYQKEEGLLPTMTLANEAETGEEGDLDNTAQKENLAEWASLTSSKPPTCTLDSYYTLDNIQHTTYNFLMTMIRTQIYLPEKDYQLLKLLAQQKDTNVSRLVRKGARLIIKKNTQRKALPFSNIIALTKGKKGENIAKNIDQILCTNQF